MTVFGFPHFPSNMQFNDSSFSTSTNFSSYNYQSMPFQYQWWDPLLWDERLNDALAGYGPQSPHSELSHDPIKMLNTIQSICSIA